MSTAGSISYRECRLLAGKNAAPQVRASSDVSASKRQCQWPAEISHGRPRKDAAIAAPRRRRVAGSASTFARCRLTPRGPVGAPDAVIATERARARPGPLSAAEAKQADATPAVSNAATPRHGTDARLCNAYVGNGQIAPGSWPPVERTKWPLTRQPADISRGAQARNLSTLPAISFVVGVGFAAGSASTAVLGVAGVCTVRWQYPNHTGAHD